MVQTKKKKNFKPLLVVAFVIFALIISAILSIFWYRTTVITKNSNNSAKVLFVVESGEGSGDVAARLKKEGLIKNYFAFIVYLNLEQLGDKVQVGSYEIPKNLTLKEVASIVTLGKIVTNKVTIPEGWDIEKISNYLAKNTTITKAQFEEAAKYDAADSKYSFLSGMKDGDSLEGFLYPDTYQISLKPTADELVDKMLLNFDKKLTAADRAGIVRSGLTTREVVTLASIVEAEVAGTADRKIVASVFLNRLNINMPLESDATVAYTLKSGSRRLTYEEVHSPTPYNTYLTAGLPKGPIGNPSIDSIEAVIFPAKSDYFYFISANNTTYFAKTFAEHNALVAKYLD